MKLSNKLAIGQIALVTFAFVPALAARSPASEPKAPHKSTPEAAQPIFKNVADYEWKKILPDLGDDSPEISIVHVYPKTGATKLMIRTAKGIHIRKHWHSANETHTVIQGTVKFACEDMRTDLGPGSFNFMPAKMVHEAWLPAGSLTFITTDGPWDVHWAEGAPTAADVTK